MYRKEGLPSIQVAFTTPVINQSQDENDAWGPIEFKKVQGKLKRDRSDEQCTRELTNKKSERSLGFGGG